MINLNLIKINSNFNTLQNIFNDYSRVDLSCYDFKWYIYKENYNKYIKIAVKDQLIKGFFTNSNFASSNIGFKIGVNKSDVYKTFHYKINYIVRNNIKYLINSDYYDIFDTGSSYTYIFYDKYNSCKVSSIKVIDKNSENSFVSFNSLPNAIIGAYEYQIYELVNSYRIRFGLSKLIYDKLLIYCARTHSLDMIKNSYFSHYNLNNDDVGKRATKNAIRWEKIGENIAFGQIDPIEVVEGWMNSKGHRENILGDFKMIGIGVALNKCNQVYYTQVFKS